MDNQVDSDLIIRQYAVFLNDSLGKFAKIADEKLLSISDDLNRSGANLIILEKKISSLHNNSQNQYP